MTTIRIVTDSAVELSAEEVSEFAINVVPLSVMINDTVYQDGVTLDKNEFLKMMQQSKALPKTSQPPVGLFLETYDSLYQEDEEVEILSLHIAEQLSGTVNSARQAAQLTHAKVTVWDTQGADQASGFQVKEAAQMIQAGHTMPEILARLEEVRQQTKVFIAVMTLENLVKGGRVSKLSGALSSILNMKVVLELVHGDLQVVLKGRGMKPVNRWLDEETNKMRALKIREIGISHVGAEETARQLQEHFQNIFPNAIITVRLTRPVISTHAGMGAFAIMYYYDK